MSPQNTYEGIPDWKLERYILGELPQEEIERIRRETENSTLLRERLDGSYYASVAATADGKIFLSSLEGDTTVVQAGPQFRVVATSSLDEPIFASPAISGGELFLRTTGHLYCIGEL